MDGWFAMSGGESFRRGFTSADAMWAALDPVAQPWYGKPISTVPIRDIYNASPAALNVGNAPDLLLEGLGNELAKAAGPAAVLGGIVVLGVIGIRMIVAGGGADKLIIPLAKSGRLRPRFGLA